MANQLTTLEEKDFAFDAAKTTQEIELKLVDSPEVLALAKTLDVNDSKSILKFGEESAEEMSSLADDILDTMRNSSVEDSGRMLIQLNKIMEKFDVEDFKEEKEQNFLQKLFGGAKDTIDHLLKKYETMGGEVDKVYVELKSYENEIVDTNQNLQAMFNSNISYYETLQKYIFAGNSILERLRTNELVELREKAANSDDQIDHLNLSNMEQALEMVEQRVYDLELAKNVALQTLPQIKMIQKGNYSLMRKINSAFIVTLPIFKQSLTQAIALKRQSIQSKAMAALDEKTNELLLKNAENTATQAKLTAQLASNSSIDVETLEKTWQTILNGIEETKRIQGEAKDSRNDGIKRLEKINCRQMSNFFVAAQNVDSYVCLYTLRPAILLAPRT